MIVYQGLFFNFDLYAKKLVSRWIGGVIIITATPSSQYIIAKGSENKIAPTTKSTWSTIGSKPPGAIPNRLFRKAPVKSPKRAPKGENTLNRKG